MPAKYTRQMLAAGAPMLQCLKAPRVTAGQASAESEYRKAWAVGSKADIHCVCPSNPVTGGQNGFVAGCAGWIAPLQLYSSP